MGKINELEVGKKVVISLVLSAAQIRATNTTPPKDYLDATFVYGKESINCKMWNVGSDYELPEVNKKYIVTATVGEYNGKKQLTASNILLSFDQSMDEFMPDCGVSQVLLKAQIDKEITKINNTRLYTIVRGIYVKYEDKLYRATSANKHHHVGIGGNIMHTLETVRTATAICEANPQWDIDIDLVKAGALLHDIGKAFVYDMNTPVMDYTLQGTLFEHLIIGIVLLDRLLLEELDGEYANEIGLLQHMIASHHGKKEYGSPVTPVFMEAYIVNYADGISATLDAINEANTLAIEANKSITDKIWVGNNMKHILQSDIMNMLAGITDGADNI